MANSLRLYELRGRERFIRDLELHQRWVESCGLALLELDCAVLVAFALASGGFAIVVLPLSSTEDARQYNFGTNAPSISHISVGDYPRSCRMSLTKIYSLPS